ncbi:hypothetical protein BU15DRAFT_68899 [Melanogaster broomeanus]|nr:hypothetical protein BU15DRAFT_68899 [Melanogaster broomeanus]
MWTALLGIMMESPNVQRQAVLQDVLSQLQSHITEFQTLLPLLSLPLAKVGLLPPPFRKFNSLPNEDVTVEITRVFPQIQRIILESILPTWEPTLQEEGCSALTLQYFCPDAFSNASSSAGDVALCAYSTILSLPLSQRGIDILLRLAKEYPIDRLFKVVCSIRDPAKRSVCWDDCLRNIFAVPIKIANTFQGRGVPDDLGLPNYFNNLSASPCYHMSNYRKSYFFICRRRHVTRRSVAVKTRERWRISRFTSPVALTTLLLSLYVAVDPTQTQRERHQVVPETMEPYNIIIALRAHATGYLHGHYTSGGLFLRDLVGGISPHDDPWDSLLAVIFARNWSENHSRVFVCWLASCNQCSAQGNFPPLAPYESHTFPELALEAFLFRIIDIWSAPDHIKHSLLSRHQYISTLLLLVVTHFPPSSEQVTSVALSPSFISAVAPTSVTWTVAYAVVGCWLLSRASRAGKTYLCDWEGMKNGKTWARNLRQLCSRETSISNLWVMTTMPLKVFTRKPVLDVVAEEIITTGVRQETSPAPTAQVGPVTRAVRNTIQMILLLAMLSNILTVCITHTIRAGGDREKDPTLNVGVRETQLGELVRSNSGLRIPRMTSRADKIEMALNGRE